MGLSFKTLQPDYSLEYITVRKAAEISGYNQQYLRRLLRANTLKSKRLGQIWLIDRNGFLEYLKRARRSTDKRFGPQKSDSFQICEPNKLLSEQLLRSVDTTNSR